MAGGAFIGLTSQTFRLLPCGSDRISARNPARPHTTERYPQAKNPTHVKHIYFVRASQNKRACFCQRNEIIVYEKYT